MSRRGWLFLIISALLVAFLLSSMAASAQPLQTVRLSEVVRSIFYAPQYVALEKGFFEDEGLRIDLTTAWGADKGAAALISGSVDVGFFGPEAAIYIYQQGAPDYLIGFAQLTQRDGSFFMSRHTPPEEFQWEQVKGKTIVGGRRGGVPQMVLEWVLKSYGIEPFVDVEVMTNLAFEAAVGAYEVGTGEYIAQFEPAMSMAEQRGSGYIVASLGEEAGPITYTIYHARKSVLEKQPELFEKFTKAIHRGQLWVYQNTPEDVAEVVTGYFPEIEMDILVRNIKRYQSIEAWPMIPTPSPEGFANLQAIMQEAGELKQIVPFEVLMTTEISEKVLQD